MGKKCEGGCNRVYDEYYVLKDGRIFCYDCWKRAMDNVQRRKKEIYREYQEEVKRHDENKKELQQLEYEITNKKSTYSTEWFEHNNYDYSPKPPNYEEIQSLNNRCRILREETSRYPRPRNYGNIDYLENATYYTKDMVKAQEKISIDKALSLFENVKKQQFSPETINEARQKIKEIEILLFNKNYTDSLEAIKKMEEEYDWQYENNDNFKSALFNFDENRVIFTKNRQQEKDKAHDLLAKIKQINYSIVEVNIIISDVDKLLKNDKYTDYVTANSLLEK